MKDPPDQREQQQNEGKERKNGVGGDRKRKGVHFGSQKVLQGGANGAVFLLFDHAGPAVGGGFARNFDRSEGSHGSPNRIRRSGLRMQGGLAAAGLGSSQRISRVAVRGAELLQ